MRILFVIENYLPHIGGVEVVFSQLAQGLAKKGHEVTVLTHRIKGTAKKGIINGVKIERVSCLGSRYLFSFLAIPRAIQLAKNSDIVHTTTFNGAPPAWIAAKICKKPSIITVHEVWLDFWSTLTEMNIISRTVHQLLEKLIYLLEFDRYVAVSKFTKNDLLRIGIQKKKVTHVYNALDYKLFNPKNYSKKNSRKKLGIPNNQFTYFAYGRPGISKGFEYLILAVAKISKEIPNSKLILMLSKDPAYNKRLNALKELIEKEGVKKNITIIEPAARRELPETIIAMDCVVVPSIREGFGFAALEPCAMGVPVVSTNAASLPEVVHGKFILVPPKDSNRIANAVIDVHRKKYKKSPAKIFSADKNISGYLAEYQKALGQASARTFRA